ncbi:MAG: urate hydroxylase PuuD [Gammaproteobacteria bacterium]|nr:urate hydroxylase PuuD [Gammaproteobacteria bacterium]
MEAYLLDWLNLLARWLHFITGIAWIGSSFYFIWLDNHLQAPREPDDEGKGVGGEVWSVHGGGFYHAQKYKTAPAVLPETLHWFKWEAYSTWLSGMFLLILLYWFSAEVYLIDPTIAELSPMLAVAIAAGFIVGGWVVYDLLCKSPLANNDKLFGLVLFVAVSALAWGLCQLFSGRGAYIHFGVILGTIMVANVFFVIIPGQKQMVAAAARGAAPDPLPGIRGKQRSVHNTYFTLPVLFVMTSNHYAMTYSHEFNWAILIAITLAGALIRIYFVERHKGAASPVPVIIAVIVLAAVAALIAPQTSASTGAAVSFSDVRTVVHHRCTTCHSSVPTHPAFPAAPGGVILDTDQQILAEAQRIYQQTVVTRVMPIGNLTGISEAERDLLDRWYQSSTEHH